MKKREQKFFNEGVEEITTFKLVASTERGDLIANKDSAELFLVTPKTKQVIPLGSKYWQKFGYLKNLGELPAYPLD